MRTYLLFSLALNSVCAEPLKNPPKVEITAVSEEPFQLKKPFDPDPNKEYTEGFYEWKHLSAAVQSRVTGSTWGEVMWLIKSPEDGVLLWNHGFKSALNLQPGKPVLLRGMAPQIRNMAEYKASTDAKKGVGGTVVGWVVSIKDGKGRIIALKGSSAKLADSYKKSEDELLKQKRR